MKQNRNAFCGGAYSLILSAVVLTILIVVNILVNALPENLTKYDISAAKLYSITSNTKAVVNGLDEDVTIYWIVQADKEDAVIENLLNKYDSLSDHIPVSYTHLISLGVAKINVNTECQLSFAEATRKYIEAGKDQQGKGFDPRKLLAPGAEAIRATVKEKMELFGSVGKANA